MNANGRDILLQNVKVEIITGIYLSIQRSHMKNDEHVNVKNGLNLVSERDFSHFC